MDEAAVQELCKQLGIGVDKASELISTYLPQIAGLKIAAAWMWIVVAVAGAAICCALWFCCKNKKEQFDEDFLIIARAILVFIGIVSLAILIANAYEVVAWTFFPEARLLALVLGI